MGVIADKMINGEFCQECGIYLEPGETIYIDGEEDKMPDNGDPYGVPVICEDCK